MANPVIAEVTRGDRVESVHRGSFVICDADGATVLSGGDVERAIFPRSAMKLIQALPLVESGAADAYGFDDTMLAQACASHSSEAAHVETVTAMLAKAGLDDTDLACGPHWPLYSADDVAAMAARGEKPMHVHNNCSGKHAGFLCVCAHRGLTIPDYIAPDHALQKDIRDALENVTGTAIVGDGHAVDGCSAPTYALPMKGLAHGFARLGSGSGLQPVRSRAAQRLMSACMANPWFMAGTGRFCTQIMEAGAQRVFAKVGAEGVYLASIPELGFGLALKCDDGNARATEVLLAALVAKLMGDDPVGERIARLSTVPVSDFNGSVVGNVRGVLTSA